MSKNRPRITARMKVDCLLHRIIAQFGLPLLDFKGNELKPGDLVVFDHVHGVGLEGPNVYDNIRPALEAANQAKAANETRVHHKIRRLRGETKHRPAAPIAAGRFEGPRAIGSNSFGNRGRQ